MSYYGVMPLVGGKRREQFRDLTQSTSHLPDNTAAIVRPCALERGR